MQDDLDVLTEKFARLGVADAESWARSELNEGFPQLALVRLALLIRRRLVTKSGSVDARIAVLRQTRDRGRDPGPSLAVLEKCLAAGVTTAELEQLLSEAAQEICFEFAYLLNDPHDDDLGDPDDLPQWALCEVSADADGGDLSGRVMNGLYEYLGPDPL